MPGACPLPRHHAWRLLPFSSQHARACLPPPPSYLPQISVLPRCSGLAEVLEAHTLGQAAALFFRAGASAIATILTESYASLATLLLVFGILFGLCRSGGIGALPGEARGGPPPGGAAGPQA